MPEAHTLATRLFKVFINILFLITASASQICAEGSDNVITYKKEIRFATLQDLYPSAKHHDAIMALELIMQKTIVKLSYAYKVRMQFLDPKMNVIEDLNRGNYDFVTLSALDYYAYRDTLGLEPILIPSKTDQPTETLILLISKDQTLSSLSEKQERTLLIENGRSGDLSKVWLDTLLPANGYGVSDKFFTRIRRVKKPGRAVIPVFFKQAEACIVTRHAADTLMALNPQIGRQLKVIYESPGLVRMLICATGKPDRNDVHDFIKESTHIEHTPDTQQAMTIIQMKNFIEVTPHDLEATEKLVLGRDQMAMK